MDLYLPLLISFLLSLFFAPLYIRFATSLHFGQNILGYVKEHESKQGTPTMGGIIFILPTIISSLIFCKGDLQIALIILSVFLAYGIVGFLDDFIKIRFKRNLGLRAYQKIIFQLSIALIIAFFIYNNTPYSSFYLPFTFSSVSIGLLIIPLVILAMLATTNSVNLTDGLDGLATGTSLMFFLIFILLNTFYMTNVADDSFAEYLSDLRNLNTIACAISGALVGFLLYNIYPAKIFMGDTGSLSLGALVCLVCLFSGTILYLPIIGIMFVVSSLSVIIQVCYFKRTHKRVFLMAPFHHHLQHKGMYETKISLIYIVITLFVGLMVLAIIGGI